MAPTIGRTVHYALTATDAARIRAQRAQDRVLPGTPQGNTAHEGTVYPAIIVRVWPGGLVNVQVLLDGPDTLWVTSVTEGEHAEGTVEAGHWAWPPRS